MPFYCIRNWPKYNRALKNRGNLTLWVSDEAIAKWLNSEHSCEQGRPRIYSDDAIVCALMVREIFHLPLGALEGFLVFLMTILLPGLASLATVTSAMTSTLGDTSLGYTVCLYNC
jgi:hypothetical protein